MLRESATISCVLGDRPNSGFDISDATPLNRARRDARVSVCRMWSMSSLKRIPVCQSGIESLVRSFPRRILLDKLAEFDSKVM